MTAWDYHVPFAQWAINAKFHHAIKMPAATAMFGHEIHSLLRFLSPKPDGDDLTDELTPDLMSRFCSHIVHPMAARNLSDYQAAMRHQFNATHPVHEFEVNDRVLLKKQTTALSKPEWLGPFRIAQRMQGGAYVLKQDDYMDAPVPLERKVAPTHLAPLDAEYIPPQDYWEVDFIRKHCIGKKGRAKIPMFLVHFRGRNDSDDEWLGIPDFADHSLVDAYAASLKPMAKKTLTATLARRN
ncbi:hypothetical protein GGI24_006959 [Coemansia furcata]|nr:hypothetical protein GGI24_006959 [Coemansia furcata]